MKISPPKATWMLVALALSACAEDDQRDDASPAAKNATTSEENKPSFDCSKAGSEAEKLVCSDPALASLDNEVSRLFELAGTSQNMSPQQTKELTSLQRGWIKGRDDCWKAEDKRQCVLESYAMRIHELRQGYADARKPDPAGVSVGPLALACEGMDVGIGMTLLAIEPGYAFIEYLDKKITFTAVPKVPEARYAARYFDGEYTLVTEGEKVRFTAPGQPEAKCQVEEIG